MILDKKFEIKSMEELYLEDEVEKQKLNSYEENDNIDLLVNSLSPINNENFNFNPEERLQEEQNENLEENNDNNKEENLDLIESISDSLPVS